MTRINRDYYETLDGELFGRRVFDRLELQAKADADGTVWVRVVATDSQGRSQEKVLQGNAEVPSDG